MPRSERERREDLEPTTGRVAPSPEVVSPLPAALLRMQATAGNRATAALVAREVGPPGEWDWPGAVREKEKPKEKPPPAHDNTVSVADFGRYKLHSFQKGDGGKVSVALDAGRDAALFHAAASDGRLIASVEIVIARGSADSRQVHTITLENVYVAGVRHAGGQDDSLSVEFDAGKISFD